MKTKKLTAMFIGLTALSASGQDWLKGSEPAWTTKPGIECPHDGKHGDSVTITVTHDGRTVTRTLATAEMLEDRRDLVIETALQAFNATKIKSK